MKRGVAIAADIAGWFALCHCWVSGAICAGAVAEYWFDVSPLAAGIVIGTAFFLLPALVIAAVVLDKRDHPTQMAVAQ